MSDQIVLTEAGLKKLKEELEYLKRTKRVQIADRIRVAKDYGDLSENAEYIEAKEEQAFVEGRILEIEHMIKLARIAEPQTSGTIDIGSTVIVSSGSGKATFKIVGSTESDPAHGKISIDSPLGKALIGKSTGDSITLATPTGTVTYSILDTK